MVSSSTSCLDSFECNGDDISDDYIYCNGNYACYNGFDEATTWLYCNGNFGCYLGVLSSENYALCGGYYGCYNSDIANIGSYFYSYGHWGSAYSTIVGSSDGTGYSYFQGAYSGAYSTVNKMKAIYGYGYFSNYYGTFDSTDVDTMYVVMYGYYAGYQSAVYCQSGSTCYVYCDGYGCNNMNIISYSNSTVSVTCDSDCDSCPTEYSIDVNTDSGSAESEAAVFALIGESYKPENRELMLKSKRNEMKTKSNEFVSLYGKEEGLKKFVAWNEEMMASELKNVDTSSKKTIELLDSHINSNNELTNGNINLNLNIFSLIGGILIVFIFGLIIGYYSIAHCTQNDKLPYSSTTQYQSIA